MKALVSLVIGFGSAGLLGWVSNVLAHHAQEMTGFLFVWWCCFSLLVGAASVVMALAGFMAATDSK